MGSAGKDYSTPFSLIDLYDKISAALDNKEVAVGFFMDLSKAFDTVNYDIVFTKSRPLWSSWSCTRLDKELFFQPVSIRTVQCRSWTK